jgi:RNA polymerase sigma factor (sigma-70 family)
MLFDHSFVCNLPDAQLLEQVASGSSEGRERAFRAIVKRHGSMVLQVCRRSLDDPNDAADAFQATFLVLLRRARSIRDRRSVAAWLHGVAARVASRARVESARRQRIERHGVRLAPAPPDDPDHFELQRVIDVELARLPEKYRAPLILCYFEGLTHEEAAARLGWPLGTVRGRLARAREVLRARLTRRGITASAALGAIESLIAPADAARSSALFAAATQTVSLVASGRPANAIASARVAAWANRACRGLGIPRARDVAASLVLFTAVGTALVVLAPVAPTNSVSSSQTDTAKPPSARDAVLRELIQLKGTWTSIETVEETVGGIPQPPRQFKKIWAIERDRITASDKKGFARETYRYSIQPKYTPKTIDLTSLNLGLKFKGVYRLGNDELTICLGRDRPADFGARQGQFQIVLRRESRVPARLSPEFPNAPGCFWAMEPKGSVPSSMGTNGIEVIIKKRPERGMLMTLAYVATLDGGKPDVVYRPVAFDDKKARHLLELNEGGSSESGATRGVLLVMYEYGLDPAVLPPGRVRSLGIEAVPHEALQAEERAASALAIKKAHEMGIEVLPRPEIGKPFVFSLTDMNGRVIRSADLKGKVLLVDCWSGTCAPCMAKMPELKALYDRRHPDGFEVIGVNFDEQRTRADELVRTVGLPWPEIWIPGDELTRSLWADGPGISGLPRVFQIDRAGILRWEGGPGELEERVSELLK